jgi:hypothetical protein
MSFECLMNVDSFGQNNQEINVLVEITSTYKNEEQFLIEADVKNAETLKLIKQITTSFVPADVNGDIEVQANRYLRSMFYRP